MKKVTAFMLAVIIAFCVIMPQTVFAAMTYDLTVTISDVNSPGGPKENHTITDTLEYISPNDKTIEILGQLVVANYDKLYGFKSPAMQLVTDEGLDIYRSHNLNEAWAIYSSKYNFDAIPSTKAMLSNYDLTFGEYGPGTYIVKFLDNVVGDPKYGVTYTVSFAIAEHHTGGGGGIVTPVEDEYYPVDIINDNPAKDGGSVTTDKKSSPSGEKIKIVIDPNENKIIGYVDVRDTDGNKVALEYDGDGTYYFYMPVGGATINVVFRPKPEDPDVSGISAWLNNDDHIPFMVGDDTGTFRPKDSIKRCEVAMILYRLLRNKNVTITKTFDDVASDSWYVTAVETLASLGIIKGMTATEFEPERPITRAEFAALCARFAKVLDVGNSFSDVPEDFWGYGEISTAAGYGWITGYDDGTYAPNKNISREEAATIVNRMLFRIGDQIYIDDGHTRYFPDVDDKMWSWYEIAEATYDHDQEQESNFVHEYWFEKNK